MDNECNSLELIKKICGFFLVSEKIFIVNFYNIQNTCVCVIVFVFKYFDIKCKITIITNNTNTHKRHKLI